MPRLHYPFLLLTAIVLCFAFSTRPFNNGLKEIIDTFNAYMHYLPQEKLYLHVDKPLFAAGEDLWFKAYLVKASFHTADSTSKLIYAELLNARGKVILRNILYAPGGSANGDFSLPDTLIAGKYVIRAYTNYMKNLGEDFFFVKEVDILNANTTTSAAHSATAPTVALQFFTEGGNFLATIENRVAFKAIDGQGKGIAAEGEIVDENNAVVTSFKSEHNGMGLVSITPISTQKQYKARLTKPAGVEGFFPLPASIAKGYIMRVTEEDDNIKVIVYTNVKSFSTERCFISLVAQSRGIVTFAAQGEITASTLTRLIPKRQFPTGITQITLFAGEAPQCERLIFVNHHDVLKFTLTPGRPSFTKRSPASLAITVTDKDGAPVSGNFSLSVYDEAKVQGRDPYPLTIANYLLLASDLAGTIEGPGYYLKDELPETKRHRDLLMMTHGWRRFTWKTVLKDSLWALPYRSEHGIVVSGKVMRSLIKKPAIGSKVKVLTSNGDVLIMTADSVGKFYSEHLLYYDSVNMVVQTDNAKGKQTELQFFLDPFNLSPALKHTPAPFQTFEAGAFLAQACSQNRITDALDGKATMLKEVEISSTKIEERRSPLYGTPDQTIKMDNTMSGYSNIFQALQGRLAGVMISGSPPNMSISIRGGGTPLLLVDGVALDIDMVSSISPNDVESIDVIKGAGAAVFGGRGGNGVIAINTKTGNGIMSTKPSVGIHRLKYPGLYKAREFYVPQYDVPSENHNLPDFRTTLYWNPNIKTDAAGKAEVSFYTADVLTAYKIVIEGISVEGVPGHGERKMRVE